MTVEEMEAFAKDYGLPALLDRLDLHGLGNDVVALHRIATAARTVEQRYGWTNLSTGGTFNGAMEELRRAIAAYDSKE